MQVKGLGLKGAHVPSSTQAVENTGADPVLLASGGGVCLIASLFIFSLSLS